MMSVISRARHRFLANRRRSRSASNPPTEAVEATASSPTVCGNQRKILSDAQLADWNENGYLLLPHFMPYGRLRDLNDELDALWRGRKTNDRGLLVDVFTGTHRERRIPLAKATDRARAKPYRLRDLYLESALVRETILDPELVEVLDDLLDGAPVVAATLSVERGTQERLHVDAAHIAPPAPGGMVGAMVLLEGARREAGPMRYFPGSHVIEPYVFSDGRATFRPEEAADFDDYMAKQIAELGLLPVDFEGNPGDVLIWHPQLYNGGLPIEEMALTQKAIVTHYFRVRDVGPDCVADVGGGRYFLQRTPPAAS